MTCDRFEMSMPRAATSVAHRNRRLCAFIRPMTRSRSLCDRSLDSGSASSPCLVRNRATIVVSSRVLQKMMALSGSSANRILSRSRLRAMPLTM